VLFLSIVEDSFEITGRGCVITFQEPTSEFRLRAKIPIQLRRPDGTVVETHIAGVEFCVGQKVNTSKLAFLLPKNINKGDVPTGTEIWLLS
jgi:hypothetical protein